MKKIIFILLILCSCKSENCQHPNKELIVEFNKNLNIVKNFQDGNAVRVDDYREALLYLVETTNIMTHADYSSTLGYQNSKDYELDMKLWKQWLNKNKCK